MKGNPNGGLLFNHVAFFKGEVSEVGVCNAGKKKVNA
jgi:hypothetical protein